MRIELTNAKFASDMASSTVAASDILSVVQGGNGTNVVVLSFTAGANRAATNIFTVIFGTYNPTAKAAVTASYELYDTASAAINKTPANVLAKAGPVDMITFAESYAFSSGETGTASPLIDVATGSTKFVGGGTTVRLGKISLLDAPDVYLASGSLASTTNLSIDAATTGTKMLISGDFTAALKSTNKVYLSTSVDCGTTSITASSTLTATEATFDINGSIIAAAVGNVCMQVDGTTAIKEGAIKATYKPVAATGFVVADKEISLLTLAKNGKVYKVLNIPAPALADTAFLRFYNSSGSSTGTVRGTLYDQEGNVLGTPAFVIGDSATDLSPNKVKVISGSNLFTLAGANLATGRAWLRVDSEFDLDIQSLIRDRTGTLVNMSSGVAVGN